MTATATYKTLMPTDEWIAYMLDVYADGWRTGSHQDEAVLVDGPDERGPWMVEPIGVPGRLRVDGHIFYSEAWL